MVLGEVGAAPHLLQSTGRARKLKHQFAPLIQGSGIRMRCQKQCHSVVISHINQMNQPPRCVFPPFIQDGHAADQQGVKTCRQFEVIVLTAPRAANYVEVEPDDLMPDGARLDAATLYREMCFLRMVMRTEPIELTRQSDIRGEIRGVW